MVLDAIDAGTGQRVVKAFFGGLDLTKGRFDFAEHPILPPGDKREPFRSEVVGRASAQPIVGTKLKSYNDWYNSEFEDNDELPRQPWNDYHGQIIGPAAWDIAREFVGRWNRDDQGDHLEVPKFFNQGDRSLSDRKRVQQKFIDLFSKVDLKKPSEDHGGPFTAQVLRSLEKRDWGPLKNDLGTTFDADTPTKDGKTQREFTWRLGGATFEKSIQEAYLHAIDKAERFIYIETQYLIGSGAKWDNPRATVKNGVPAAIADKIVQKLNEDKPFHAYLVVPMFPEGDPVGGAGRGQRQFQFETMRFMAKTVAAAAAAKGKNWKDFLSFYFLANWTQVSDADRKLVGDRVTRIRANKRYMIYVHSKLMIIDDEFVILGSANLNERSLAGDRDAEICVALLADDGKLEACKKIIEDLRVEAWKRHLGGASPQDGKSPESASCAKDMQRLGRESWIAMSATERKSNPAGHLLNIPFDATAAAFAVSSVSRTSELQAQDPFIFDAEAKAAGPPGNGSTSEAKWSWPSPTDPRFFFVRPSVNLAE